MSGIVKYIGILVMIVSVAGCTAAGKPWVGWYLDGSKFSWDPRIQLSFLDETVFGEGDFLVIGNHSSQHNPMSFSGVVRGDSVFAHLYIQFQADDRYFPHGEKIAVFRGQIGDSLLFSNYYSKPRRCMSGTLTFESKERILTTGHLLLYEDKPLDQRKW